MTDVLRAGVLLGGLSPEREVSLLSGKAVEEALAEAGWEVAVFDYGAGAVEAADLSAAALLLEALTTGPLALVDAVFIALHGGAGEDGRVQAVLEMTGVPYTGTGVLGSAVSMDKWVSKALLRQSGVPVPDARLHDVQESLPQGWAESEWGGALGWPLVIRPVDQGSTVGLTIVDGPGQIPAAMERVAACSRRALIEQYVPGREMTVAVLEGTALPVIEIRPSHGVYDYECKYTPGMSEYVCPAQISSEVAALIQQHALTAFGALDHRDYSRMDFRLDEEGTAWLLEGNTAPGFTATSLVPKAAKAAGIGFPELCDRLVRRAVDRQGAPL